MRSIARLAAVLLLSLSPGLTARQSTPDRHLSTVKDIKGKRVDPFKPGSKVYVFVFVRTDCPITNRYAPELKRIAQEFANRPVAFSLVYPDRNATADSIRSYATEYHLVGNILMDPKHELARLAQVSIAPEAAVFDNLGQLRYHGRIDDLYISLGRSRPGGALTHDLEAAITAVAASKPVRKSETKAFGCSLADVE